MLVVYEDRQGHKRKLVVGVKAVADVIALVKDLGYELVKVERGL